jgi:SAM-dependent methyltransferase
MRQHYASTTVANSIRQVINALRSDDDALAEKTAVLAERRRRDEARIARALGREVKGLDVLIIGPGPYLIDPRFFGRHNAVTAIDLDVIPRGFSPAAYFQMLRQNGLGRLVKTVGRKLLGVDRRYARAWRRELGVERHSEPRLIQGDILNGPPGESAYDVVASWSVFQHIADPALAIHHVKAALRPGGVMYIAVHLYTSNTGHHDMRAFTGDEDKLTPWAHLRKSTQGQVTPSAWINKWRLRDWRAMFAEHAPGYEEYRQIYDEPAERRMLTPEIRAELVEFDDEELLTTDVYFLWKKPVS